MSSTPSVMTQTTATTTRRSNVTWVRMRRMGRLFGTSARSRSSATSSTAIGSVAMSQAVAPMTRMTRTCMRPRRHGSSTASLVTQPTAISTARAMEAYLNARCECSASLATSRDRRPSRRSSRRRISTAARAASAATSAAATVHARFFTNASPATRTTEPSAHAAWKRCAFLPGRQRAPGDRASERASSGLRITEHAEAARVRARRRRRPTGAAGTSSRSRPGRRSTGRGLR